MSEKYSVFIGDVALDEYYLANYWPNIKDKSIVRPLPAVPGGMIANAACVAAALGMQVKFLAMLNRGAITQLLLADLQKRGIDTSLVMFDDTLPDAKCMIFLVEDEHTVIIPTMGITHIEITPAQLDVLAHADVIYSTPIEFDVLHCGDMDNMAIRAYCRAHGAQLVFDLDVDYVQDGDEARYQHLNVVLFNEVGFDRYRGDLSMQVAADRLLSYGISVVVVTQAAQGCMVYTHNQSHHVPGFAVDVVDVTGAGDTFGGSFVYARAQGDSLVDAARFANATAAICVGGMGARAGAVTRDAVEVRMGGR
ncbi:MAG: carbohydrate kinase family protein [Roseiflexaceae bacterium]